MYEEYGYQSYNPSNLDDQMYHMLISDDWIINIEQKKKNKLTITANDKLICRGDRNKYCIVYHAGWLVSTKMGE